MSSKKSIPWSDSCLASVWQMSSLGLTVRPRLDIICQTSARQPTVRPRNENFFLWHENFGFYFANSCTFTFPTKERIFSKHLYVQLSSYKSDDIINEMAFLFSPEK